MPDQLQLRGGTTSEHGSFTGALREVTVDTTKKTLVVHDGSQAGGTPLMRESGGNAQSAVQIGTNGVNAISVTTIQDITFTGANSNLTWDKSDNALELQDNGKLKLGNNADLEIYHASDHSYILDSGTGELRLASDAGGVRITKGTSETMALFIPDVQVELYFDNLKKLQTTANGIEVFNRVGIFGGTAPSIQLNTDASGANTNTRAMFGMATVANNFVNGSAASDVVLNVPEKFIISHGSAELMAVFNDDGAVQLYHDNVISLQTIATGCEIVKSGSNINADLFIKSTGGGQARLQLEAGGNTGGGVSRAARIDFVNTEVESTPQWTLINDYNQNGTNDFGLRHGAEKSINALRDNSVELYFDNDKKFETASIGNYAKSIMPSSNNSFDLGQNAGRWRNLYISDHSGGNGAIFIGASNDMELKHEGSFNFLVNHNSKNFALQAKDGENALIVTPDAGVKLYFNDLERFETTLEGCQAQKMLRVNGASGEDGSIIIQADGAATFNDYVRLRKEDGTAFFIENISNQSTWEKMIVAINAGAVELYFDHSRKLRTFSEGITTAETVRMEHGTVVANRKQTVYQAISSGTSHTFTTTNGHGGGTVTVVGIRNGNSTFATTTVFPFALRSTANAGVGSSIVSVGGAQGGFSYNVAGASQGITVTNNDNTTGNFYVTFDITGSVA